LNKEKKNKLLINDIIFGLILVIVSLIFCFDSIGLERPKGWLTAPGLFPLIIFSSLGCMGLFLLIHAIKGPNLKLLKDRLGTLKFDPAILKNIFKNKTVILIIIFFTYYIILSRILPFELSTFIYLFAIFKIFWKKPIHIIFISAFIGTMTFSLVFERVFKVMLPGIAWRDMLSFLT